MSARSPFMWPLVAGGLSGCLAPTEAEPTTPSAAPAPAPASAAGAAEGSAVTVEGPISLIDGKPAPHGIAFQVAPGCHLIRTSSEYLTVTDNVSVRGTITPAEIVIEARPGHRYLVERTVTPDMNRSEVQIFARELDGRGQETRRFVPLRDPNGELARCRAGSAGG